MRLRVEWVGLLLFRGISMVRGGQFIGLGFIQS